MNKVELIDRVALIADLKKQFAAVYKDTMLRPIMDDDPFVDVLAKSEGQHLRDFLDWLEAYLMTRPTIDVQPARRGEWVKNFETSTGVVDEKCSVCRSWFERPSIRSQYNFCPNCGAKMVRPENGMERLLEVIKSETD